jgi:hypothetical protein
VSHAYDDSPGLAALFARQSRAAEAHGSLLYTDLCRAASLDLAGVGQLHDLLAAWRDARAGDMLPLRVLGAAHRLVLERRAPALALWFPSVGGHAPLDAAGRDACFTAWVGTLVAHADRLPDLLASPPQTNDPGRAASLAGVLHLVDDAWHLPVRLHELGTSAGLNLRADLVRITWPGGAVGPAASPLVLHDAWVGGPMPPRHDPLVVERVGCDLEPVDVSTTDGRLHLTSFVWPDQAERFERLRAAFALADRVPAEVVRRDLVTHLRTLRPQPGTVLVVCHSSTWMYLDAAGRAAASDAFDELAARASEQAPVVHVAREYLGDRLDTGFAVVTRWWPAPPSHVAVGFATGSEIQHADTPAHGLPVTWMPAHVLPAYVG